MDPLGGPSSTGCVRIEFEFEKCWFLRRGETKVPGEKPLGARTTTNNKLNPHMTPRPGMELGPHWWEASALTTAPTPSPLRHVPVALCQISCNFSEKIVA